MASQLKELISVPIDAPVANYWKSVEIFLWNSRITSKNVAGVIFDGFPICQFKGPPSLRDLQALVKGADLNSLSSALSSHPLFEQEVSLDSLRENFNLPETRFTFIWIVKILYKNIKFRPFSFKCYVINFQDQSVTVLPLKVNQDETQSLPYQIQFSESKLIFRIDVSIQSPVEDKTVDWLLNAVVPRFEKWMGQELSLNSEKSLKLIDCQEYNEKYNSLKSKYGADMIAIWPERTDPAKFVYEDVAIATYLLLIWKQERQRSGSNQLQSFVDLGCGNGLLVYILTMEGHKGFGIDLRKRGIWDIYPKEVDLRVETIIPSDVNLYPTTDWIIGNHSDELSPWVPVIAARSSTKCRFFLLPCCAFDFNGQRFQRRDSSVSQYLDFMEYAKQIATVCGYDPVADRLKIPSTKRICLIGYDRTGQVDDFQDCSENIGDFIRRNTELGGNSAWSLDFRPRESVEAVRNCTKVNQSVINEIVDLVFKEILMVDTFVPEIFAGKWNIGRSISLNDLATKLPKDKLAKLKSECGGLQTLLKNHHQIFEVKAGSVNIRIPLCLEEKKRQLEQQAKKKRGGDSGRPFQFQQKPCYFKLNHPQGCPWPVELCTFKHQE